MKRSELVLKLSKELRAFNKYAWVKDYENMASVAIQFCENSGMKPPGYFDDFLVPNRPCSGWEPEDENS